MDVDEAKAAIEREGAVEPFSQAWWRGRSNEELHAIMARGFGMGPAFDGAAAETERRARESLHAREQSAEMEAARRKMIRRVVVEAIVLACLLTVTAMLLTR